MTSYPAVILCLLVSQHPIVCRAAPSAVQLENLTRGNNSAWFGSKTILFDEAKVSEEMKVLNKVGIRHIRLCMPHQGFIAPEDPTTPLPEALAELSKAISYANKQGLAVIVNPFHYGTNGSRHNLYPPQTLGAQQMVKFWGALAKHLSATDPNLVFFEIGSEPTNATPANWLPLQNNCHKAIRDAAPAHVIIATAVITLNGSRWDSITNLTAIPAPIRDENTVYNFHYRSPTLFTNQGRVNVGQKYLEKLTTIPYPSHPENIAPLLEKNTDPDVMKQLTAYGEERWDRNRIRADILLAAKWAQKHGVRLTCNEFGCYRKGPDSKQRAAYLTDVREVLEEFGIGWTVWGDTAGIINRDKKSFTLDRPAAVALGIVAE